MLKYHDIVKNLYFEGRGGAYFYDLLSISLVGSLAI